MTLPITQSREWQKLQEDLDETNFYEEDKNFSYLAILKSTPVGNYLYVPYGPIAKDRKSFKDALAALTKIAKEHKAIFIRIEPQDTDFKSCLPKSTTKTRDLNPKETWVLDLTGTDEEFKTRLPSRLLRYYKNRESKGIEIVKSHNPDDIHYLLDLQKALAKEKGISTFSEEYLKTELKQPFATLYIVKHRRVTDLEGAPRGASRHGGGEGPAGPVEKTDVLAAGLVFDHDKTRYNLQGAQTEEGRALHATGILTIELIKDARKKNLKYFDFWGIAPENASKNHPWAGFTNFKKTFAGYEVDYLGTHDVILNPLKYHLYALIRKLNRRLHKA